MSDKPARIRGADSLEAVAEIERLKARYFRCVDASDWVGLRALFTDDALVTMPMYDAPKSADDAVASISRTLGPRASVHTGTPIEIVVEDADHARGTWAMDDRLFARADPVEPGSDSRLIVGTGVYHERYRRDRGTWRIAAMRLERDRVDFYGELS